MLDKRSFCTMFGCKNSKTKMRIIMKHPFKITHIPLTLQSEVLPHLESEKHEIFSEIQLYLSKTYEINGN